MTPLIADPSTTDLLLKLENHQKGGSYKIRGVQNFLTELPTGVRRVRVLSAGNMARTLTLLAKEKGIPVKAYLPDSAPEVKQAALRELGAETELVSMAQLWAMVETPDFSSVDEPLLHPFDSPSLLRGYARLAQELLGQNGEVTEVITPFGVGGFALALAYGLKRLNPELRVVAAEGNHASPLTNALKKGGPVAVDRRPSWIDAIGTPYILGRVFQALRSGTVPGVGSLSHPLIDEVRVVDEKSALENARNLHVLTGEKIEGAAAVALAAGRQQHMCSVSVTNVAKQSGKTVAIMSGGNVNPEYYL